MGLKVVLVRYMLMVRLAVIFVMVVLVPTLCCRLVMVGYLFVVVLPSFTCNVLIWLRMLVNSLVTYW